MHEGFRAAVTWFRLLAGLGLVLLAAPPASAWPAELMHSLSRDARRLVPRSLARLLGERESEIFGELRLFPPELARALAVDLGAGRLRPETLTALDLRLAKPIELFRQRRVSEGLVQMGALLRVPADLADPVLSAGSAGYAPGVARQYYAFVERSLGKIPVVLDDRRALELGRHELGPYWQRLLVQSSAQSQIIDAELFRGGRLVDQRRLDHRNPVFGVASLSYSRAVNGIAATWLVVWREVQGDLTRMPRVREIEPRDGSAQQLVTPQAPSEVSQP